MKTFKDIFSMNLHVKKYIFFNVVNKTKICFKILLEMQHVTFAVSNIFVIFCVIFTKNILVKTDSKQMFFNVNIY